MKKKIDKYQVSWQSYVGLMSNCAKKLKSNGAQVVGMIATKNNMRTDKEIDDEAGIQEMTAHATGRQQESRLKDQIFDN